MEIDNKTIIRAIHVKLEAKNFNQIFKIFLSIYRQSSTSFKNGYHMYFWLHLDQVKSNKAKGTLTKVYK